MVNQSYGSGYPYWEKGAKNGLSLVPESPIIMTRKAFFEILNESRKTNSEFKNNYYLFYVDNCTDPSSYERVTGNYVLELRVSKKGMPNGVFIATIKEGRTNDHIQMETILKTKFSRWATQYKAVQK